MIQTEKMRRFIVKGVGQVISQMENYNEIPLVLFDDGKHCLGLQRDTHEIRALGYDMTDGFAIAKGNFEHEACHLFLSSKFDVSCSVAHRQAEGADFEQPEIKQDAFDEERIVLGFQMYVNEIGEDKLSGFNLHIGLACQKYAEACLQMCGYDMKALKREFNQIMLESNGGQIEH